MTIDVPAVPFQEKVYVRQNLFSDLNQKILTDSIGVNLYQDFAYTKSNASNYFAMTSGVKVLLNHLVEFGVFCSYWVPSATSIKVHGSLQSTMYLNNYLYCGNTLGLVLFSEKPFHPKFSVDVGLGEASATQLTQTGLTKKIYYPLLVIKPAFVLESNIFSFLQWTFGARYRFQLSIHGPSQTEKLNCKADGIEISTGPVFNIR